VKTSLPLVGFFSEKINFGITKQGKQFTFYDDTDTTQRVLVYDISAPIKARSSYDGWYVHLQIGCGDLGNGTTGSSRSFRRKSDAVAFIARVKRNLN